MASRRLNSFLALALFSVAFAHAQTAVPSDIPVDEWLRGPDRHDFPWKVKIRDPWLTFQQRHTVQVHADFRLRDLKKHGISADDLHLLLKVADSDGKWLPGEAYSPLEIKPEYGNEVDTVATFYARPGKFKVALIAYDARNHRGNLWRGELTVPALKGDPLPNADLSLPVIQFLPQATVARSTRRFGSQRTLFDASAFGKGKLTLPVDNERPVQVDIVANLALSDAANTPYRQAPDWMYKINADTLLQISNVLTQVDLKNGCVRFSAIDILRQKTFIERQNAATIDWDKIIQLVEDFERVKIEARVLASQKQTADAFAKFVEKLLDDPGCAVSSSPLHVLVVVGDAFIFPNGTAMRPVRARPESQGYYFKLMPIGAGNWDQVESVLKPIHPTRFEFSNSIRFRQILASFMERVESTSRVQSPQSSPSPPTPSQP